MENYLDIIAKGDMKKIQELFSNHRPEFDLETSEALSQFKIAEHDVFSTKKRPKKKILKDTGEKVGGQPSFQTTYVEVARIGMPLQELIVNRRVGFALSVPVYYEAIDNEDKTEQEEELIKLIDRIHNDNKMDYKNREILRAVLSQMECAELWYFVPNENASIDSKFTVKVKVLTPDNGDKLFPLFDETGNLISFARGYKVKEGVIDIEHYDIYTDKGEIKWAFRDKDWKLESTTNHQVGKMMIIYHSQKQPEWHKVQSQISRLETLASNHADMNDYYGSPILAIGGQVLGYIEKGSQGGVLQLEANASANYLALASEPQSIKMEKEDTRKDIFDLSQTPDITFEKMTGLGQLSGVALELLFLDAHMAVRVTEEMFGIGLQRRVNLLKAVIGKVLITRMSAVADKLQLKPVITPYLPNIDAEVIENIASALGAGIMSKETGREQNPLVTDSKAEKLRIEAEKTEELAERDAEDEKAFQKTTEEIKLKTKK